MSWDAWLNSPPILATLILLNSMSILVNSLIVAYLHREVGSMPKKRDVETRLAEMEDKMDKLKLEKAIKDMKIKLGRTRPRRRVRR